MATPALKMSADEFQAYAAGHGRCELVRGEVRSLTPAGGRHGKITMRLASALAVYVERHGLGEVLAAETGYRLDDHGESSVRAPDISFLAGDRAAESDTPRFIPVAPDLAVETLSPDDTLPRAIEKVRWWLGHGVRAVWLVDPEIETVTVYRPGEEPRSFSKTDTLTGGDVVPGFSLRLARLFR